MDSSAAQDDIKIVLPLPCSDGATPIASAFDMHVEGENTDYRAFYFTVPMDCLRPSPTSLFDTVSTRTGDAYRQMLVILFHFCEEMFYGKDRGHIKHGITRRFRVFMEYLVDEGSDLSDYNLIDAVGVRFHFHVYDAQLDLMTALVRMIVANGGSPDLEQELEGMINDGDGGLANLGVGGPPAPKRRKQQKKNANKKPAVYESYLEVDRMFVWFDIANRVSGNRLCLDEWATSTTGNGIYVPGLDHPFHPSNLFSWENSLRPGMLASQRVEGTAFGLPSAVYYLNGFLTTPLAMLGMTLPRTPLWYNDTDSSSRIETLNCLHNKDFMKLRFNSMTQHHVKRNDLREIRVVQDRRLKKLHEAGRGTPGYETLLRGFRESAVKYVAGAWKPGAHVSRAISQQYSAAQAHGTWTVTARSSHDPGMSFFGNMIASMLIEFENVLRISTVHTTLLRVLVNALDAYRYENNLHNNVVLLGQGATGKSHLLDTLRRLFVTDTVSTVSHITEKAMAVDTDNNDHVTTFHEMPPSLMGLDKTAGGVETGNHIIKDMMTSCKIETHTINVNTETNRRHHVHCSSECVGVFIMATNERLDKIPEALATRMIPIVVNDTRREKFTINDMTCSLKGVAGGEYRDAEAELLVKKRWEIRQIMINMVEKMIFTGCLEDVCMNVFETMQLKVTQYLQKKGIMYDSGNIREIQFMKRFARTLTLLCAVDKFANDPESPGFNHGAFGSIESFQRLSAIQPLLFCTEEIALFCLTLNADQIIKVHHFKLMEVLLATCADNFEKTSGELDVIDGFLQTHAIYRDERDVYRAMKEVQSSGNFAERLSAENMKVAFNEIRKQAHNGKHIVQFSNVDQIVRVNAAFVEQHFRWDADEARHVCLFDLNLTLAAAFEQSYVNRYTRPRERMILGTVHSLAAPFLLNTMDKRANPDHVLVRHLAKSNESGEFPMHESGEEYEREFDTVKFKIDYELFVYKHYLRECGFENADASELLETLYKCAPGDATGPYPEAQMQWFNTFVSGTA